jgi:hypothetical protein
MKIPFEIPTLGLKGDDFVSFLRERIAEPSHHWQTRETQVIGLNCDTVNLFVGSDMLEFSISEWGHIALNPTPEA